MSLVEREGSNVHPCAEMLNDGGRRVPVGENGPGKRSMGVGRKEGVWMDGRLRQLRESVSKASAPKLNQRQPPGVMSQTPTHSSLKDAVWHSPPMTR